MRLLVTIFHFNHFDLLELFFSKNDVITQAHFKRFCSEIMTSCTSPMAINKGSDSLRARRPALFFLFFNSAANDEMIVCFYSRNVLKAESGNGH